MTTTEPMLAASLVTEARETEWRTSPRKGVYCCLLAHALKSEANTETYVFVANNPVQATLLHNRRQSSTKDTRSVAPYWHLIFVVGPFVVTSQASAFAQNWVNSTRGCTSKIQRGTEMAERLGIPYYSVRQQPAQGTLAYLKKHAPRDHVRAYLKHRKTAKTGKRKNAGEQKQKK